MKVIGLTGGIGSGKTTVAKLFAGFGISTYIADEEAKALMLRSKVIQRKLIQLFGESAYLNGKLNKPFIANAIFNNKELLQKMNAIVHPKVAEHFKKWVDKQNSPYVLKESAILFEQGGNEQCDYIILVTAPEKLRIERVITRDTKTVKQVKAIINNQLPESEKRDKADFVIENIQMESTQCQAIKIHNKILKAINK